MLLKSVVLCALLAVCTAPVAAADRHEGYYYPEVTSTETFKARTDSFAQSSRRLRLGFVVGHTQRALERPYPPDVAVFAKGAEAEKIVIVALRVGPISTIYQARALLAQMTAVARTSDVFVQNKVSDSFTFLDLLKLVGFKQLTISDGHSYAHQITIE